ncbi:CHAT domain-containing tetratricopeptide repeat protein [Microcoleus vaginatus]|uniref:CHAT domain-containing tetratricopeptide repeat protein n=1 Tax=Microcoleus vaginatus TaxID=119532 RepID=UPI001F60EF85|nr:CHAT domain-containing protein [Microcoleus vaginatus HSN003]
MQPFSLALFKFSNRKVRSGFLFPLAFCLLSVAFYIPPHSSLPANAQAIDARQVEADRLIQQGLQQYQTGQIRAALNSWQQALQIYRALKNRLGEGVALGLLGDTYDSLGNSAKAIEYKQRALTIAREIKNRHIEGLALRDLGRVYYSLGNSAKAIEYSQQSLAIARERKDHQREAVALGILGAAYLSLGDSAKAIEYSQQQLAIAREIKDRQGEGLALGHLGGAYLNLGNWAKAIEYSQQSLAIAREIKNRKGEGTALGILEAAYYSLGNYTKAIEYTQQSLAIARSIKDRQVEGVALGKLGLAYRFLGNYTKAIEYSQLSLAIARSIKDRHWEALALGNLELAYLSLGNSAKAIEYAQQSLAIARSIKDRQGEGRALRILGAAYYSLGNYTKAIDYTQQTLAIARSIKDREGEGNALGILGLAYGSLGNWAKAIEYAQQSLAIARSIKNREGEGNALGNLGLAYRSLGNWAKAIEYSRQTLAIAREIKNRRDEGAVLGDLGFAYNSLGNYAQAIEYSQQSLAIAREIKNRRDEGAALRYLGIAYGSVGNYAKAIEYTQQSLVIARSIKDRQAEGNALGILGAAYYSLGNYTKGIEYTQLSLANARSIKDRNGEGAALNNLGAAFLRAGNLTEAEKMLFDGIQVWESMRQMLGSNDANKVSIFEGQERTYQTLQEVRVAQNNPIAALEIAERGRARAFVDLLTERLSSGSTNPMINTSPNQEQIRQIAKAQNATLVQYSIVYDEFQIQGKSEPRESALYIWVIQPTGEITFRQVDLKPLWQQHNASLASLIVGNQEFLAVRSRSSLGSTQPQPDLPTLHQLLIDPIASLLPTDPNARVIFIPQGALFQVPFPALQDASGTYLIEKHTILTAPSIQVLDLTRQQRQKLAQKPVNSSRALVLGNPTMPSVSLSLGEPKQQLSPLPGAEAEAIAIAPLLNTQAITGAQGTKAAIVQKMPQASTIHLATHGLLDDVHGLGSAIALAPSGSDDGLLTAEEIFDMKLQANLVVLSACNTGEGRITGDGVIGLSRALISAGVPSVIVSLWAVPDAPTSELMQAFYQNLQKNPNKAQALRQAMLTTMKTHPGPRNWAAFTLIGEAE